MASARAARRRRLLAGILRYPELIAETLVRRIGKDKLRRSFLCADLPWSDQFSGQGTTYVAMNLLTKAFKKHGIELRPRLLSTCERVAACQKLLQNQHPGVCNWADEDSGVIGTRSRKREFSHRLDHDMRCLRLAGRRLCTTHNRACQVLHSQLRVGGTPCTDFSMAGKRRKLDGDTMGCTISWLRQSYAAELAVHENVRVLPSKTYVTKYIYINIYTYIHIYLSDCVLLLFLLRNYALSQVPGFPPIVEEALAESHRTWALQVEPADVGFGFLQRKRTYRICVDKRLKTFCSPGDLYQAEQQSDNLSKTS